MKIVIGELAGLLVILVWLMGAVLAKGFWSTFFAIFFFPYGMYLTVERVMILTGFI